VSEYYQVGDYVVQISICEMTAVSTVAPPGNERQEFMTSFIIEGFSKKIREGPFLSEHRCKFLESSFLIANFSYKNFLCNKLCLKIPSCFTKCHHSFLHLPHTTSPTQRRLPTLPITTHIVQPLFTAGITSKQSTAQSYSTTHPLRPSNCRKNTKLPPSVGTCSIPIRGVHLMRANSVILVAQNTPRHGTTDSPASDANTRVY